MRHISRLAVSMLIGLVAACSGDEGPDDVGLSAADSGVTSDAGEAVDAGEAADAGEVDATEVDAGAADATAADAAPMDAMVPDVGSPDAMVPDVGFPDAMVPDVGLPDVGFPDAGFPDAAVPDAGSPADAGGGASCDVEVNLPETNAGQVGASGGSVGPFLECAAGQEIVGVAVRISDQNTSNGGPSAVGFTILCASLTVTPSGPILGTETPVEVSGTGQFGWTPATQSTLTRCPAGWLVSGLEASRGSSSNRFLEVSVTCSELAASGATTGATQTFYLMGSGSEAGTVDTVACAAGEVVRRLGTRVGAGLDAVTLYCAAPSCAP